MFCTSWARETLIRPLEVWQWAWSRSRWTRSPPPAPAPSPEAGTDSSPPPRALCTDRTRTEGIFILYRIPGASTSTTFHLKTTICIIYKDIYVIVVTQYSDFICDVTVHTCTHCSYTTQTKNRCKYFVTYLFYLKNKSDYNPILRALVKTNCRDHRHAMWSPRRPLLGCSP